MHQLTTSSFPCSFSLLPCPTLVPVRHFLLWVPELLQRLISFFFRVPARGSRVAIILSEPILPSTLPRTSATTGRTSTPRASPTWSWMTITSTRWTPAVDVIERPLWVHSNSNGRIWAVMVQARRAVLDATPIPRMFTFGRRSVRNLT